MFAGSNQVKNSGFVLAHKDALRAAFLDHGMERARFLSRVRVWTQNNPSELAVEGALGVARTMAAKN